MQSAIDFALEKHSGQVDKGGRPYFGHVLRVALSVLDLGEDYFIAAILHDVVEDCDVPLSFIAEKWGQVVADAVDSVSRRVHPVKETYMSLIERASKNQIGLEVKLADLQDNMQPERIAALPPEGRDILKRYNRALNFLREVIYKRDQELARQRHTQMLIDGGGA